jgi:hypothetical protein
MMRVRVTRRFWYGAQKLPLKPGDVVNIPEAEARTWLHHGMAMMDKTVDVPENKAEPVEQTEPVVEVKPKPKPKRKAKK